GRGEMIPEALEERIRLDRRDGAIPVAAVATAGTTGTGAIDPLGAIAAICSQEQVWFHVDACYGGGGGVWRVVRPPPAGRRGGRSAQVVFRSRHGGFTPDP